MINFEVKGKMVKGMVAGSLEEVTLDVGTLIATVYSEIKEKDDQAACIFTSALIAGTEKMVEEDRK